jgi:hypothetical protein
MTGKCLLATLLVLSAACGNDQACTENDENLVATSRHLGDLDDKSKRSVSDGGTLSPCNATEYLHYYAEDTGPLYSNNPTVDVRFTPRASDDESDAVPPELESCVYVACWYGATKLTACNVDGVGYKPVESPLGFLGCCRGGSGAVEIEYECDNSLVSVVSDDDAEFYVHLCAGERPQASIDYSITATF